jgi:hypothetical protein
MKIEPVLDALSGDGPLMARRQMAGKFKVIPANLGVAPRLLIGSLKLNSRQWPNHAKGARDGSTGDARSDSDPLGLVSQGAKNMG